MAHSIQTPGGEVTAGIPVLFMRDQLRILHVDDDWTGLSNREERKKRQNRLNQRSRRKTFSLFVLNLATLDIKLKLR